jgi:hypothetical protein
MTAMAQVKYFTFGQNNSGGSFIYNERAGIGHYVIVEAIDADHANQRARAIGLYFDGCSTGMDCDCCGDRWSEQWGSDAGTDVPMVYHRTLDDHIADPTNAKWGMDKQVFVHYISGQITAY